MLVGQNLSGKACSLVVAWAVLIVQGCATAPPRTDPVPEELADVVQVPGIPYARSWADVPPAYVKSWYEWPDDRIRERFGGIMDREHAYLAISGGGENGAFGAGLLTGWTQEGSRPEFVIVTGISTGGLIAPFAFLGPAYDPILEEMYTSYATADLLTQRKFRNAYRNDAVTDTDPMKKLIARYMTDEIMEAIAIEYRKGRALLIGTTNIDAARPVMWSIGRIAASGHPDSLQLIRDIMLASAAIPGAFPPVTFEVEADGALYEELHVDGGVTSQVFLYPLGIDIDTLKEQLHVKGTPKAFVIRNAYLKPHWKTVERRILPLLGRTVSSLTRTQGIGDLYRMYWGSVQDGAEFNLAFIPDDFEVTPNEMFDPEYMKALYERGRSMAVGGYPWLKEPPLLDGATAETQ